jgi:hypothetical protein
MTKIQKQLTFKANINEKTQKLNIKSISAEKYRG